MVGKVQGVQVTGKFICQSKKLKEETMIDKCSMRQLFCT